MKIPTLPKYGTYGVVPRRDAWWVFKQADKVHVVRHSSLDGSEEPAAASVSNAQAVWDAHKRVKMSRREDGAFVFVIGHPWGYDRYTIWGVP